MVTPAARKHGLLVAIVVIALALVGMLGASVLLTPASKPEFVLAAQKQHFPNIAFSPDGARLLLAGWDAPPQIWDISPQKEVLKLPLTDATYQAAFASDGQTFAIGRGDTKLTRWNLAGERQGPVGYHHSYISGLAYSPNGQWLASSGHSDCTTRIWEANTGKKVRDLTGHFKWAGVVAFSPDSQLIASCDMVSLRLWDVASGRLVQCFVTRHPMHYVAFSPDSKTVISGSSNSSGGIEAWDVATGNPLPHFSSPKGKISQAVFTSDGKYIVALQDQSIVLLEAGTGRKISALVGESWQDKLPPWLLQIVPSLKPPASPFLFSMALSPDSTRLAYSTEKEVRVIACHFR